MPQLRFKIAHKFFAVLVILTPLIIAVAVAGSAGLGSMKAAFDRVFTDNIHTSQVSTNLGAAFAQADMLALQLASGTDPGERDRLLAALDETAIPRVDLRLSELQALHAHDPISERVKIERLADGWSQFVRVRDSGALNVERPVSAGPHGSDRLIDQLNRIFLPFTSIIQSQSDLEASQAGRAYARAVRGYHASGLILWTIAVGACLLGIGSMLLLTRNVVPRIRRYSRFASAVATGDLSVHLNSRGTDELAVLGRTLDEMVERREFVDALQVTEGENVAHDLLRRQIERSVPGSTAVVLNRNNSNDRLEAVTPVAEGSSLAQSLDGAKPRSCMAVRFARVHSEDPDREPLAHCDVCGTTGGRTTCEPLLVGGEVIGSVLIEHADALQEQQTASLRSSVSQAAPVLANLRSLSLAQFRASTDGLTGLPNKSAVTDTVKRMAAHTSRTFAPLSAIMFDLDHFKQINDSFGHGCGDDVLAAVGEVLPTVVRTSDFAGRNGGEEFIVLLPDTDTAATINVAEKIRSAIAKISVPGVDRPITVSLGVATMPQHAGDGDQLVRNADRALYLAKSNGRNRVETATGSSPRASARASVPA
jgi:diguanylate cyclase (GGDEF)-like protein